MLPASPCRATNCRGVARHPLAAAGAAPGRDDARLPRPAEGSCPLNRTIYANKPAPTNQASPTAMGADCSGPSFEFRPLVVIGRMATSTTSRVVSPIHQTHRRTTGCRAGRAHPPGSCFSMKASTSYDRSYCAVALAGPKQDKCEDAAAWSSAAAGLLSSLVMLSAAASLPPPSALAAGEPSIMDLEITKPRISVIIQESQADRDNFDYSHQVTIRNSDGRRPHLVSESNSHLPCASMKPGSDKLRA